MSFGEKLQKLRKRKGLSQEQLAQILQVSRQTISKWESGINHPELEKLKEISAYFEVSLDELLGLKATPLQQPSPTKEKEVNVKKIYMVLTASLLCMLILLLFSYHKLSTRLERMQESISYVQSQSSQTIYVDSQPVYGFLGDVHIAYEDIDVLQNTATQIVTFSLRSQKETALLYGEYRIKDTVEKIEATSIASLSYELRKQVALDDEITLMVIYEDEDGIKSDSISFERNVTGEAIGYVELERGGSSQYGTKETPNGQVLDVRIEDTLIAYFPNKDYPFQVKSYYIEISNHDEVIKQTPLDWQDYEGDMTDIYQSVFFDGDVLLRDGDEITIRVCIEDEQGIKLSSSTIVHVSYTKKEGLITLA